MATTEVRYERLRPEQIRERREACPALYIPLGTVEWHGVHNPVGLDTLKAHALAVRCAQKGGGLVFPALWYAEDRSDTLMDSLPHCREEIADVYRISHERMQPGYMPRPAYEQNRAYVDLLVHMLTQGWSLGFRVITLVAGHYPLLDYTRAACCLFNQINIKTRHESEDAWAVPWTFTEYELVQDRWPEAGDHAAYWETSLLLALEDPELVDLSRLPADKTEPILGVGGAPPQEADAEFGREAVELIVERATEQVRLRLEEPWRYRRHGLVL